MRVVNFLVPIALCGAVACDLGLTEGSLVAPGGAAPVATVDVKPTVAALVVGSTAQLTAVPKDQDGNSLSSTTVNWTSSDTSVALVSDSGVVKARKAGRSNIKAKAGRTEGSAVVVVSETPLKSVAVTPHADTIKAIGYVRQLSASAKDSSDADAPSTTLFAWTSLNPAVATVDADGNVTAKSVGTALIIAAAAGIADTAQMAVQQVPADLQVTPASLTVMVGSGAQLQATVKDSGGTAIPNSSVSWTSSAPSVASVSSAGLVNGLAEGAAAIAAISGGVVDSSSIAVVPTSVTFPPNQRPYSAGSPWNSPIPIDAAIDPNSAAMVATISANGTGKLRSDPEQYTYPVYFANSLTPRVPLVCSGRVWVNAANGSASSISDKQLPNVPIPPEATPSSGTDGQIIIIDSETGDEYDVWRFTPPNGCENVTKYERGVFRDAVEPVYISRGAGVPYLAGLIRPWEIAQGHIDHALAFAYATNRLTRCVYPASKTDGKVDRLDVLPEGARLRLNPTLNVDTIPGLDRTGRIIARALQQYGAYVIDNSGANKLYAEDNVTANWGTTLVATTVSPIPVEQLQVLRLPDAYWAGNYSPNHGNCVK
jgi:uncharacterized protein YjdB